MSRRPIPCQEPARTALAASAEPVRLVIIPGLLDARGEPLIVRATGSLRRPVLTALVGFAALAMSHGENAR
jgi:hypothetical protein